MLRPASTNGAVRSDSAPEIFSLAMTVATSREFAFPPSKSAVRAEFRIKIYEREFYAAESQSLNIC